MKLVRVTIENFRGYKEPTSIEFDDLTVLIGKNDVGKSTVLEALDVFFYDGKGTIKLDSGDINVTSCSEGAKDIKISAVFGDLPDKVIIDAENETTLRDEYLLNRDGHLEIIKTFKGGATTASSLQVSIKALHPSNAECDALLSKKNADLKKIVDRLELSCDRSKNATMRAAIWKHYEDSLNLQEQVLDVLSGDGDIKAIWSKLQGYLPYYSLFQSDRKNSDSDSEVQDPLKEAVKQILGESDLQAQLASVAQRVEEVLQRVANLTLDKVREMNPEIANSLHPKIPSSENLKWADVFVKNLAITGDEDIPINKRGSGVRRLILLNFFRAEVERRKLARAAPSVIYAIEEPETSQHVAHQRQLISALKELSKADNVQILLTTHSSHIVKELKFDNLRLLVKKEQCVKVEKINQNLLPYPSLCEVNYWAFDDISQEFHNELYGALQAIASSEDVECEREKPFDDWLERKGCTLSEGWICIQNRVVKPRRKATLPTFIRNSIHHPENRENRPYNPEELRLSIEQMIKVMRDFSVDTSENAQ